jgi:ABC-2 type transport system ATP-binding protein
LERFGLAEKRDSRTSTLSGGMKRRVMFARALMHDPEILFLDEPTAGVDVELRYSLWSYIRELNRGGLTIFLTTHYMEEAEELCDRVAVMDHGRVLVCDTPRALIRALDVDATVLVTVEGELDGSLGHLPGVQAVERDGSDVRLRTSSTQDTIVGLMQLATERGVRLHDLSVRSANLEDVFISYTGRSLRE